jgi:miniconductance mechanosensitive channel
MEQIIFNPLQEVITTMLEGWGLEKEFNYWVTFLVLLLVLATINFLAFYLIRGLLHRISNKILVKSSSNFVRLAASNGMLKQLSILIPVMFSARVVPLWFVSYPSTSHITFKFIEILLVIVFISIIKSVFRSFKDYLSQKEAFQDKPLESYLQITLILLTIFSAIIIFTLITGISTWKFLSGLGAASAILMLVFKDTILGFVASIQVSANDMVRVGDWIEMPKYNADGSVLEITLNTVKVQNWDKTITTIPTYMLVTESIKNWRGMQESGGRRIKRSVNISSESVHYLEDEELNRMKNVRLLQPFIENYSRNLVAAETAEAVNQTLPTNLGLFREYLLQYIKNHPEIRQDMTLIVRHLAPTENGVPLEVYVFTNTTAWVEYERIMSEIFEHIFATIPYFGLKMLELYPYPYGSQQA